MQLSEKVTVLWSFKQQCFHIEHLKKTLQHGLKSAVKQDMQTDYVLVGICDTRDEAHDLIANIKDKRGENER